MVYKERRMKCYYQKLQWIAKKEGGSETLSYPTVATTNYVTRRKRRKGKGWKEPPVQSRPTKFQENIIPAAQSAIT
jgi:hypothetical protein